MPPIRAVGLLQHRVAVQHKLGEGPRDTFDLELRPERRSAVAIIRGAEEANQVGSLTHAGEALRDKVRHLIATEGLRVNQEDIERPRAVDQVEPNHRLVPVAATNGFELVLNEGGVARNLDWRRFQHAGNARVAVGAAVDRRLHFALEVNGLDTVLVGASRQVIGTIAARRVVPGAVLRHWIAAGVGHEGERGKPSGVVEKVNNLRVILVDECALVEGNLSNRAGRSSRRLQTRFLVWPEGGGSARGEEVGHDAFLTMCAFLAGVVHRRAGRERE